MLGIRQPRLIFSAATIAALVAAAGVVGMTTSVAAPAHADPLSPHTGARPSTSSAPHAGPGGHVYYIDSTNGSDSNTGLSKTSPWKSLAKVNSSTFKPGDVIAFDRGDTFTGAATLSSGGTAANPITVTAYGTGAQPVLTNPGQWNILVLDASYISVKDLAFTNSAVFNNDDGTGITGPKYELSGAVDITANGDYALVQDNVFTDVGVGVKTYGQYSDIEHNSFENLQIAFVGEDSGSQTSYGAIGVSLDNSNEHVAYNNFINCRSTDSPYGADGGAIEIEGFDFDKNDITIDHNYSRGSQGFLEVTETHSSNVNLSYNVSDDYQQFIAWDTTTTPDAYTASNNTVIRRHDSFSSPLFDIYYYRQAGPTPTASWITIQNNIFDTPYQSVFGVFDFPHDHNLFYGGPNNADPLGYPQGTAVQTEYALGTGDLIADPQFVNYATGNLRLKATSPAIDNGAATTTGTDLAGKPTNVGAGVDMGAFEYQGTEPTADAGLVDGGFENQTTVGYTTTPWRLGGSLYSGIDVNQGKAHSGLNDAYLASSGAGYWGSVEQTVTVTPHSLYRFSIWERNSANIDQGYIGAKTPSGTILGEVRQGTASDYTHYIVTFNSGNNTSVDLFAGYWGPGPSAYAQLDDAALTGPTS
ncbi:choice-of-anchor Q domain-containing protein [Frondihabitans australicus]|uniref:Parallel beta helix pectate lyase-like protein n=1 Tax=Frondihabitans australicus TaxID=386892 RepID=A0A495IIQ8_9MICO|nr:choice-of-anchor Q domain-containing protein [Frondihabitans australicus]RKR75873.1 hypothetical protein C8E83_3035 [Frondihabitans australicus]